MRKDDFWKIYDELTGGIDPSVKIKEVICGHIWTAVINDAGGVGMAMTTPGETRPRTRIDYQGMRVRDAAAFVRSWNFLEAGIGMAAINSFYNTEDRLETGGWEQRDRQFCSFSLDLKDKTIGMVGHLRFDPGQFAKAKELYVLELNAREGDYPASACEDLIPRCDIVIITGSAFINKTMPRLLNLAENAFTIITGPSVPMASQLTQNFDIQRIAGFIPGQKEMLVKMIAAGCNRPPYEYGRRFFIDKQPGCGTIPEPDEQKKNGNEQERTEINRKERK